MADHEHKVEGGSHDDHHGLAHVSPIKLLIGVWFWLMVFTVITVAFSKLESNKIIELGNVSIWLALVIATVKGTLVIMYFMHLRYDKPFNTFIFLSTLLFVAIFLSFAMMDSGQYQDSIKAALAAKANEKGTSTSTMQILFGNQVGYSTKQVVSDYLDINEMTADSNRGYLVYKQVCSGCHKIGNVGSEIGPDLTKLSNATPGAIVTNILDPNFLVLPAYVQYVIEDDKGVTMQGIITRENDKSIFFKKITEQKAADGTIKYDYKELEIAKSKLESRLNTNKSLMPEKLEDQINKQQMADLVAFIRSKQPDGWAANKPLPEPTN